MRKVRGELASPAMVVAIVALVVGLAGTGVAATISALGPGEKTVVRKISRQVANKQITQRAPGLAVASAAAANSARSAENVIAATVAAGCGVVSGATGTVLAAPAGTECNVTFTRSVSDCAILLGALFDVPGGGETTYRKVASTVVQVSRRDSAGGSATAGAFSIAAICPA
jgi:hypothetical protein